MNANSRNANQAIQKERQRLLIDATMSAIADVGLGKLTLAGIAGRVGLTAGSVNFHFASKEALLLATLTFVAEEFEATIEAALAAAGSEPDQRLAALINAYFDPDITEPRKMAVWHAFSSEARGRQDYQLICGTQDKHIFSIILDLCTAIIQRGGKQDSMSAFAMANAVQGLLDEVWQEILYVGPGHDRERSVHTCMAFLASVFPWSFDMPRGAGEKPTALRTSDKSLRIIRATSAELQQVSRLFDLYRQFYNQPADLAAAHSFVGANMRKKASHIFLALDAEGQALGFTQLYPGLCSVATAPFLTLYDLYVVAPARQRGVARALMEAARQLAVETGAIRIDLETELDNYAGQALYEDLGYEREREFYKYSLEIS